jgi:Tol biopolymer transport system component
MPRRLPLIALLALGGLAFLVSASTSASLSQPTAESRDGLIAFGSTPSTPRNEDIFVMNPDGTGQRRLTDQPGHDSFPAWSPDGQKIAFTSRRNVDGKANTDTYVMEADGSTVQRLTRSPAYEWYSAWSPDGGQLAFMSFPARREGASPQDIYVMNADGSGRRRLTHIGSAMHPTWSPDGRKIAFASNYGISTIKVDGTGLRRLTRSLRGPGWESDPAWSPDGRQIAFTSAGSNTPTGIYVMKADGTGRRRLTTSSRGWDSEPGWSPDGRKIAFVCSFNQISDICVVGVDGRGRRRLTEDAAENRSPNWQRVPG